MFKVILAGAIIAAASIGAHATEMSSAIQTIERALACDLPTGQAKAVSKALKTMGAKPDGAGTFALPGPLLVDGLPATQVHVGDDDGVDTYIAVFHATALNDVAAKASLKPLAASFVRDTKHGRLSADVRDRTDVWLTCTVTQ